MKANNSKDKVKSGRRIFYGILFIIGIILLSAYFRLSDWSIIKLIYDVEVHLLGKLAVLLPLTVIYLSIKGLLGTPVALLNKNAFGTILLVLCLLGTAHHIFVPVAEELTPHLLPMGGGLAGGLIALCLNKLGRVGGILVLVSGFLISFALLIPMRYIKATAKKFFKSIFSSSNPESKNPNRPRVPDAGNTTVTKDNAAGVQNNVYKDIKFDSFHDGIKRRGPIRRIMRGPTGVYDEPDVKENIEKDPVTIPSWTLPEEFSKNVITRPVIDYGTSGKYRGASTTDEAARSVTASEDGAEKQEITLIDSAVKGRTSGSEKTEGCGTGSNGYVLPPLELLKVSPPSKSAADKDGIMKQCAILEQTLADFRVSAKVVAVTRGPSVTRFELQPAPGVKVSSVVNLADDIALRLAAPGVRIEAPIPGKSAIGIEAPNIVNDPVAFRKVVEDPAVRNNDSKLCIGLGKDISGNIITADLTKMPHLLVAGSTGSGKSVCINTIIAGILFKARPDEVKLILVDPKVVELTNYNGIPHLLTPVVTEPKKAASALHWAVVEMERRYQIFADSHVREIKSYNETADEKLPYIVIIIDELSDLMMVAKVDVEDAILRLAQKARAAGIHLIIATQRPSVDVITGIVKANIPSRIAFAVSSQTDSRTILDMGGAEKLLGKGDMLFYPIGYNKPIRVQGAFVSDSELNKTVAFIVEQSIPADYKEEVTQQALESDSKKRSDDDTSDTYAEMEDDLLEEAISLVLDMGQASASMLQRRFRIGYNRAARLVDKLEELGIIGPPTGSKPREVIMARKDVEERFLHHE